MGAWNSREEEIHLATRRGDGYTVAHLLDSGVSVDCCESGRPLLCAALDWGHYDVARLLINRGATLTSRYLRATPLHHACRRGAEDMTAYLLQHGASVDAADGDGCTPLCVAVAANKMSVLRVLLQYPGVNVNQQCNAVSMNHYRDSLINKASNLEVSNILTKMNLLFCEGQQAEMVSEAMVTPFYHACESGYTDIAALLISTGCDTSSPRSKKGWKHRLYSPLHVAAEKGHTDIVRLLCGAGVDVNVKEDLGRTPLMLACDFGRLDEVEALLQHNAEVNSMDTFGHTPLFYSLQASQRWLKKKIDGCYKDAENDGHNRKWRSAIVPCDESSFSVVAVGKLLEAGADMNCASNSGTYSPIHYAITYGHLDAVCVLLRHGARLCSKDIQVEHLKWTDLSILKLLLTYSPEFHELAKRISRLRPDLDADDILSLDVLQQEQEPDSLLRQCRLSIRRCLQSRSQRSILPNLQTLPLPLKLKQFLSYYDMHGLVFKTSANDTSTAMKYNHIILKNS